MPKSIIYPGQVVVPYQSTISHEELTNQLVIERGIEVVWEKAVLCPCINREGVPNPTCKYCYGRGFTHINQSSIPVLFTRLEWNPTMHDSGLWILGSAFISTTGNTRLGVRDRIKLEDLFTIYSETTQVNDNKIKLNFIPKQIEHLLYFNSDNELEQIDLDEIEINNNIVDLTSLQIADDTWISARYLSPLSYLVVSAVHEARGWKDSWGNPIALPNQYLIRREDAILQEKEEWTSTL